MSRVIMVGLLFVTGAASADVILDWSEVTLDAIRADRTPPPRAARTLAMVHLVMFDAVNATGMNYEPYLDDAFDATGRESPDAAAVAAAHRVLSTAYPQQSAMFDAAREASLAAIPEGPPKADGIALGQRVADGLLVLRADDGADAVAEYTPGTEPGDWQPTPPDFTDAVLPQWPYVEAFCIPDVMALRRPGPPLLTSAEYTTSFNEVKLLGAKSSTARTAEQTEIAWFWVDGPGTATPPGHWFQIARDVAIQQGNTLEENARLFALIGMAVCDAGICAWDNKYAYDDWRPITAIRAADSDGNPETEADPAWESLIPTPPFPSYVSGHSTFSGAGSKVLALFYGSDEIAFTTTSDDVPDVTRSFERFSQAANEAGRSRIYGGIHWEYDNQDGLASGRELAIAVYDNFLQPVEAEAPPAPMPRVALCGSIGTMPMAVLVMMLAGARFIRWRTGP